MAGSAVVSDEAEKARKAVWSRKAPFATFYIAEEKDDRVIKVETTGKKGQNYEDLMQTLNDKNARYFLYDYVIMGKFNKKTEKTVFVFWSPPNCNQQMKMMYSAYLVNFRDAIKFAHHETFQDEDDFNMFSNKESDDDEDSEMSD
eukprot:165071_1